MQIRLVALSPALKGFSFSPDAVKNYTIHINKIDSEHAKCVPLCSKIPPELSQMKLFLSQCFSSMLLALIFSSP